MANQLKPRKPVHQNRVIGADAKGSCGPALQNGALGAYPELKV
jgi:hypothetical protein